MGSTIAGFITQTRAERGSIFYQEHWRSLIFKVEDPYIRAVLTRVAGEDFDGLLVDEAMPLLDRITIAVYNLTDKEVRVRRSVMLTYPSLQTTSTTDITAA
jgi:hypothetical protein